MVFIWKCGPYPSFKWLFNGRHTILINHVAELACKRKYTLFIIPTFLCKNWHSGSSQYCTWTEKAAKLSFWFCGNIRLPVLISSLLVMRYPVQSIISVLYRPLSVGGCYNFMKILQLIVILWRLYIQAHTFFVTPHHPPSIHAPPPVWPPFSTLHL